MRPIIAQMSTPTYAIAKILNKLITPYVPTTYSLNSTTDFIDIINTANSEGEIASLDVDNLFTNVPLEETIDILMDMVYHREKPSLPIPETIMRELLKTCTTEAPFRCHKGHLYRQTDGVSMGSPLGVLFAEAYMAEVEKRTFTTLEKPKIYARFRDDIFVNVKEEKEINQLSQTLTSNSVLGFTTERSQNKCLQLSG